MRGGLTSRDIAPHMRRAGASEPSPMILGILKKLFWLDRGRYLIYQLPPGGGAPEAPAPDVRAFERYEDIPPALRDRLVARRYLNVLYYRMKRRQARVLCLCDGDDPIAYGWIQSWAPFRRRFGSLFADAVMLGPYWTAPARRRQGLYARLLAHSLSLLDKRLPIVIYTSVENVASQKGIEKAGFQLVGRYEISVFMRLLVRCRPI